MAVAELRRGSLAGDVREQIPKLGLREYWYPGVLARRVGRRPVKVRMLGEDLAFFRGRTGRVVAVTDVCPHRGASLAEGDCHWPGTIACPYHGWVFDEHGRNIAVLSEGPQSRVCGKPGTEARVYATEEHRGVVFVWMGTGAPAPIQEDVPEEFFDPGALVLVGTNVWPINWEVALENSMDSHVNYLHRNSYIMGRMPYLPRGARGEHPVFTGNGFTGDIRQSSLSRPQPPQDVYPEYGFRWPKRQWRRLWTWIWLPAMRRAMSRPPFTLNPRWSGGHRLPSMYRTEFRAPAFMYTRACVPIDERTTRIWYYYAVRVAGPLARAWRRLDWALFRRWAVIYNFSQQDERVMRAQRWDTPEKLSETDAEIIQWRRLVVTKHEGGRDAPFEYRRVADAASAANYTAPIFTGLATRR